MKVGENAVTNPDRKSSIEDIIKDLRRPKASEIAPQIGEVIVMARNTMVVRDAKWVFVTFHVLQCKAGANTERIIISIASAKKARPAEKDNKT